MKKAMACTLLMILTLLSATAFAAPAANGKNAGGMVLVPDDDATLSAMNAGDEVITLADARMDDPVPGKQNNNNMDDGNGNTFANS